MVLVKLNLKNSRIVCFQFSPPIELGHSSLTTNLVLVALKSSFLGESPHSVVASCSLPFCVHKEVTKVTSFVLEGGHCFPRLILYTSSSRREKPEIAEKVPLSCSVRNTSQNKRTGEQLRNGSVSERAGKMARGKVPSAVLRPRVAPGGGEMFGISVHIATADCGDNRDKPRFVEQGASTIWSHITKTNTRLVILRFSRRRSLEHGPASLPGE